MSKPIPTPIKCVKDGRIGRCGVRSPVCTAPELGRVDTVIVLSQPEKQLSSCEGCIRQQIFAGVWVRDNPR